MKKDSLIFVAGSNGMVGSAIVRNLVEQGFTNILTRTRKELDLCNQQAVNSFFETHKPEYVFLAAAKVGGIVGNKTRPAEFIYENLAIETNVIHAAHIHKVTSFSWIVMHLP
jgi:GDP-L-fucose synthase